MDGFPQRILLAADGSENTALAARAAVDLAKKGGAELHVVHARQDVRLATDLPAAANEYTQARERWAREDEEFLEEQTERLRRAGGNVAVAHLKEGRPDEEIVGLTEKLGASLVVLGSRGLGAIKRLVLGSVSEVVTSRSPCPVLVVRGDEGSWPRTRVVAGADPSEETSRVAELAVNLGGALGAEALLVLAYERHTVTSLGMGDPHALMEADRARNRAWGTLSRLSNELRSAPESRLTPRAVLGDAATVLKEVAGEGRAPALVAVGRRRPNTPGGVSAAVLHSTSGPVL